MDCSFCSALVKQTSKLIKNQGDVSFFCFKSNEGQRILNNFNVTNINSVVYIDNQEKVFFKSNAVLKICRLMRFPYSLLYCVNIFPDKFLDFFYDYISRNRYCIKL